MKEILNIHFIISPAVYDYMTTLDTSIDQLRHSTEPKKDLKLRKLLNFHLYDIIL
mgnify:CR=1 FL=1